ncbi:Nramp family divalent metal transporter [Salibacter halophilus]|uniref:Nramp family divalent metal transporter n=1 Tax=Salibacter halophilus TaxID=1803916 RepID=UPI001CB89232|nr:Nramp family divalent metal transporter [Salibacter halophilus]
MIKRGEIFKTIGPGLLYAGAAIGVSHLVQSTRAGASYGIALLGIVIVTNIIKYPFFEYGPRYAAATGNNLLDGYEKLGKWTLVLFAIITVGTMFTVQAAITVVTAGLAQEIIGVDLPAWQWSVSVLILCAVILFRDSYKLLDKVMRYIIILLTIATVTALVGAFVSPQGESSITKPAFDWQNHTDLFFLIALIGWMPAPFDISVWHSIWSIEKNKKMSKTQRVKAARTDFHVGYWGTTFLAICFMLLGAKVLYTSDVTLSSSGSEFAAQLISIYTETLGDWSYPIIGTAALTTMFSTSLTVMDGFTRVMVPLSNKLVNQKQLKHKAHYRFWLIILVLGAAQIVIFFVTNMHSLVDLATTISFVTAPIIAILNYSVINSKDVKKHLRPKLITRIISIVGILLLSGFAVYFLFLKFS